MKFGYLNFQGRGQVCRLLLAYTKLEHQDIQYEFQNIQEWFAKDRVQLNLDFPSLPYLVDGKVKLTQSKAIEIYIIHKGKRLDLVGRNSKQTAMIQNIEGVIRDVFNSLIQLFMDQKIDEKRKSIYEKIKLKLNYLDQFVGKKNHLMMRITYADFLLNVLFNYLKLLFTHEAKNWHNLERVANNVNQLPEIKAYYSRPDCVYKIIPDINDQNLQNKNLGTVYQKYQQNPQQMNQFQLITKKNSQASTQQLIKVNQQNLKDLQIKIQKERQQLQQSAIEIIVPEQQIQQQIIKVDQINKFSQFKENNHQKQKVQQKLKQKNHSNQKINEEVKLQKLQKKQQQIEVKIVEQSKTHQTLPVKTRFKDRLQGYMKAAQQTNSKVAQSKLQKSTLAYITQSFSSQNSWIKTNNTVTQSTTTKTNPQLIKPSIILGSWGIRGLGQIQRHLLSYSGLFFRQKLYSSQQQWFNGDRLKLGLPFPNLPYLIQKQFQLTESLAIDRYIIRKSNNLQLLGKNLSDQTYIQNIVKILSQFFKELRVICFIEDQGKNKVNDIEVKMVPVLQRMNDFVKDKQYVVGYLTWADFYVAEISYYVEKILPDLYNKFKFFFNIRKSIENNQKVQTYYQREKFVKGPFMPPSAKISF